MANENLLMKAGALKLRQPIEGQSGIASRLPAAIEARIARRPPPGMMAFEPPVATPPPPPPPPAPVPPAPVIALPTPSEGNPFATLPYPSAGDRIKADDFRTLSQSLKAIYDAAVLSSVLFGRAFGEVKLALATNQYSIARVMSVFGAELNSQGDPSLDQRKVIQVMPVAPGEQQVLVVVTEAVDTRRYVPNLVGLTYREAMEQMRMTIGDAAAASGPIATPNLVGHTLGTALQSAGL